MSISSSETFFASCNSWNQSRRWWHQFSPRPEAMTSTTGFSPSTVASQSDLEGSMPGCSRKCVQEGVTVDQLFGDTLCLMQLLEPIQTMVASVFPQARGNDVNHRIFAVNNRLATHFGRKYAQLFKKVCSRSSRPIPQPECFNKDGINLTAASHQCPPVPGCKSEV